MQAAKPGKVHQQLQKLAGSWSGEEKMHPSPWDSKGGVSTARIENRVTLDGLLVVGDYEQSRGETVTFRGHSIFSYDPTKKGVAIYWFDSMGAPPNIFRGNFEGDVLTTQCHDQQGFSRVQYDLSEEGTLKSKMEISRDGKQWNVFMEGRYTRQD